MTDNGHGALKIKYADLLPPLSTDEFDALKASIKRDGVAQPIVIDEDGVILDGHHRYKIDKNAPRRIVKGLSESEKVAFVYRSNLTRRNLSPAQRKELMRAMRKVAQDLNHGKLKQADIAAALGVDQTTVSLWLNGTSNMKVHKACKPKYDSRVKVPKQAYTSIYERVQGGERQSQIAADYGVTQQQISGIVTHEAKHIEAQAKREQVAVALDHQNGSGIFEGDFRILGQSIADDSIDLVFTDPPYSEDSLTLYSDLAQFAARILRPGGLCIAYSGHFILPQVLNVMSTHLAYMWVCSIQHTGGDLRFRKYQILNNWKPLVTFYKPPLSVWWDWLLDTASGGKEKDGHAWQQAESEAEHFISGLCPKNGTIVDPFCGSGTTIYAAKSLGLKYIGYEIDHAAYITSVERLSNVTERSSA